MLLFAQNLLLYSFYFILLFIKYISDTFSRKECLTMTYQPFLLTEELHITQIITIHYFEYTNTYHFHGESHDFWEFLCVDKGEVTVTAGEKN